MQCHGGLLITLIKLLGVTLRYKLLEKVHLNRRNLIKSQKVILLHVPLLIMTAQFVIELKDDLDEDLDVESFDHVPDNIIVYQVLLQSQQLVLVLLLLVFRVQHQCPHKKL